MSAVIRDPKKRELNLSDRLADGLDPVHEEFSQARLRAAAAVYVHGKEDRTLRRIEQKVGRNEPCPCGSGKKFKRCHYDTLFAGRYR